MKNTVFGTDADTIQLGDPGFQGVASIDDLEKFREDVKSMTKEQLVAKYGPGKANPNGTMSWPLSQEAIDKSRERSKAEADEEREPDSEREPESECKPEPAYYSGGSVQDRRTVQAMLQPGEFRSFLLGIAFMYLARAARLPAGSGSRRGCIAVAVNCLESLLRGEASPTETKP